MPSPEELKQRVEAFVAAFEARDLEKTLSFFSEDACVHFIGDDYVGTDALRTWIQDRFDANLRIVKLRGIDMEGEKAILRGEIDSDRIRAWPASGISGIMTIAFEGDLFKEFSFGMGVLKRG
jgi:ketosteroid isomerase-like protein